MPNQPDRLKWGPYLSNRQWGTVREDYSANGDAWNATTHDQARSKAWRWGEEGIGGISDDRQHLCFAPAFWNGQDPILKERFFGLTNGEGNHGEDVKELYYYLDSAPDHSYMRMLYKYPQAAFPYEPLLAESRRRNRLDPEFEILDTGIFDGQRYFDIFIEYAKAEAEDVLVRITACNRGPDAAPLTVLPTIWLRNTWTFSGQDDAPKPHMTLDKHVVKISHVDPGDYFLFADGQPDWLFCENETNNRRLYQAPNASATCKDGINDFIVHDDRTAVNKKAAGTKAAARFQVVIPAGGEAVFRLRLTKKNLSNAFTGFDEIFARRRAETDAFYANLPGHITQPEARNVQRQAYAGMLWTKQFYAYDVARWLDGDPGKPPPPPDRRAGRNSHWRGFASHDILSMPDKWEFPWFAAWDLAFQCLPLVRLDPDFAKNQLETLFSRRFQHPDGQIPAYEWNFDDLNPPVKAWATWQVFALDRETTGGRGDRDFLKRMFPALKDNYRVWWTTQKDHDNNDLFGGGFLGLDNIGVFDRSKPLDSGDRLEQADATAWMAFSALYMFRIALELNEQKTAAEFFKHFLIIANAVGQTGTDHDLWDDEDEFFYDNLRFPDSSSHPLKVHSMVGLIPMFAVLTLTDQDLSKRLKIKARIEAILGENPHLANMISRWQDVHGDSRLLSLLRGHRTKALLRPMLHPPEFWSDYGVRSLSKQYLDYPYEMHHEGDVLSVKYVPGNSDSDMFGGNSNWRGPIWMPLNYLLVQSLREFYRYYGPDFLIEYPIATGQKAHLGQVADEIARRLTSLFLPNEKGERPVHGEELRYAQDPYFRDLVLFYEYFHGDTGQGLGASHQTGWTGLVALLLETGH